jgi:hypothetical protein
MSPTTVTKKGHLAVLTYNLSILFQRHLGWMQRVNVATLRYRLFQNAGLISFAQGLTTIKSPSLPKIELGGADFGRKFSRQFPTAMQLEIAPLFLEIFEQKSLPTHQRIQPNCMDTA